MLLLERILEYSVRPAEYSVGPRVFGREFGPNTEYSLEYSLEFRSIRSGSNHLSHHSLHLSAQSAGTEARGAAHDPTTHGRVPPSPRRRARPTARADSVRHAPPTREAPSRMHARAAPPAIRPARSATAQPLPLRSGRLRAACASPCASTAPSTAPPRDAAHARPNAAQWRRGIFWREMRSLDERCNSPLHA